MSWVWQRTAFNAVLALCLLSTLLMRPSAHAAAAVALGPDDRAQIRDVIERQLDAFQRDDASEAFSYAAPQVRGQFGTAANFMRMVRESYQAVYRPRAVRFLEPASIDGQVIQAVQVVAPDGDVLVALYYMQRQPDAAWRIAGCLLAPATAKST